MSQEFANNGNTLLLGTVDDGNSTSTPLNAGNTFTGSSKDVSSYPCVVVSCLTNQAGALYVEFSTDNVNWDSSIPYSVAASTNEVHRLSVSKKYCRVRFTNTSASNQTYLRLQTLLGSQPQLTSALSSVVQSDADSILVRPLDFNLMVAESLYQNRQNTIKDGINLDIDTATVPEDIWTNGGTYTGFPTGAVEAGECVVAGADTGTVYYSYLASSTSTDYVLGNIAVAGAGTYALGHNVWRCNFMYFVSSSPTNFNAGDITIRNTPTTANVFCTIPAGYGQSFCSAYTVPASSAIYLDRVQGAVRGSSSAALNGFIWFRSSGESPRLRFPFVLNFGSFYFDDIDYLTRIPAGTDLIPRITASSANNIECQFTYRIIKVKD